MENNSLKESRRLALALTSSSIFLSGMLLAAIAVLCSFNLASSVDEEEHDQILATAGMFIIAASVLPEIAIDLFRVGRPIARGRYADKDGYMIVHCLQHILFLSAALLQGYSFLPGDRNDAGAVESSFLLSPVLFWTASALLAVSSTGCCCCCQGCGGPSSAHGAHQTANAIFLGMALAMCAASQNDCDQCYFGSYFRSLVYVIVPFVGCGVGALYLYGDCYLDTFTTTITTTTTTSEAAAAVVVVEAIPITNFAPPPHHQM